MNVVEEGSRLILIILVAILFLQIITKGNGQGWIGSFFTQANNPNPTPNQLNPIQGNIVSPLGSSLGSIGNINAQKLWGIFGGSGTGRSSGTQAG